MSTKCSLRGVPDLETKNALIDSNAEPIGAYHQHFPYDTSNHIAEATKAIECAIK